MGFGQVLDQIDPDDTIYFQKKSIKQTNKWTNEQGHKQISKQTNMGIHACTFFLWFVGLVVVVVVFFCFLSLYVLKEKIQVMQ